MTVQLPVPTDVAPAGTRLARPALSERINRALDRAPLLLVAGAGYGKTLAVEGALAERPAASAWIRCTEADRDAGHLLRRIVDAVRIAVPGAVDVLAEQLAVAQERVAVLAIVDELLAELDRLLIDEVVLVVDDAEHLQAAPDAASVVARLIAADVPALRIVVATRRPLPLRLAKLRGSGRLVELGAEDLAFSPEECAALVPEAGDAARLFAATDGWPLGAALGAVHGGVRALEHGSRAAVFEFLEEELLDALPADLRAMVIDAGIVRALDSACMQALGLPEDFPERVAQAGLPLRASASEPGSPTFHPLVREFLLERLAAERAPEAVRALHARAAAALASQGSDDAVDHWLAAGEWSRAAEAIAHLGAPLVYTAPATVRRWLAMLPAGTASMPRCRLLEGTLEWSEGRFAAAIESLRAAAAGFARSEDVIGEWLGRFALADPLCVMGEWDAAIALADGFDEPEALAAGIVPAAVAAYAAGALGAVGRVAESELLSRRVLAHPHLGRFAVVRPLWEIHTLLLAGRFEELLGGAEQAVRECERFDPVNRLPILLQLLAVALGHQGREAQELACWERVEASSRRAHMGHVCKLSHAARALLHARAGRLEAAEEQLALATTMGRAAGWSDHTLETARARTAALRGDVAESVEAAESALALLERAPLTDRFHATLDLAPVLLGAGLAVRARSLVDRHLALCEQRLPGAQGRHARCLLLGLRAWLRDATGDEAGAIADLKATWAAAGPNLADVARREWRLLEPLVAWALERGELDADAVVRAVETALPGGEALLAFTTHPNPRVRSASVAPAAASGRPDMLRRIGELADDADPGVAAAARAAARRLPAEAPALSFTLFGGFGLRRGSWSVEDPAWDRRVAQRLVRFLLVHRGSAVPDDLLLEAFWPDKPVEPARRSLRVAVSCARAVLDVPGTPSAIDVVEGTLSLRLRERDRVDVDRFARAAAAALADRGDARRRLLERAAGLWAGEPLPEERYATWAAAWRENLAFTYARVLTELVRSCRAEHDDLASTEAARRLVQLDPLDEGAHRELILSYARSGRRSHALRQYLECRRTLVDQLGIEPAAATTALQQRILAGEPV